MSSSRVKYRNWDFSTSEREGERLISTSPLENREGLQLGFAHFDFVESEVKEWYALYTRSRHEQVVKKQLDATGIENLLPVHEKVSQWKDRKKRIQRPLFPGYVFVKILLRDRLSVLKVSGVVSLVGDRCTPLPIPEDQISSLKALIERGLAYDPYPYLKIGQRVRIVEGPLTGVEGFLIRKKNQHRFVLSIDLIQRSVAVEIDSWRIERV
jgi:transcription termination/antitermination protein NusG